MGAALGAPQFFFQVPNIISRCNFWRYGRFDQFGPERPTLVRAREEAYEACMVEYPGAPGFPKSVNMENKLRTLQAERGKLLKLCKRDLRGTYEYGKETKLVKIVIRHLRATEYHEVSS